MAESTDSARTETRSAFTPLVIVLATFLAWNVFETNQLMQQRDALRALRANQDKQIEQSQKVRDSLNKLVDDTHRLSQRGNKDARLVIDELQRRGVLIPNESASSSSAPAPAPSSNK